LFHWYRWGKTHALLIEGGLTYGAIKQSVANARIAFREGVVELFEFLEARLILLYFFFLYHHFGSCMIVRQNILSNPVRNFISWFWVVLVGEANRIMLLLVIWHSPPYFSYFILSFDNFQERNIPVLIFSAGLADIIEEVSLTKFVLEWSYSRYIEFIH
jgi:hypothetical protein